MGLFSIFAGKSPEGHEEKGDACFQKGAFGEARIEFEKALYKIKTKYPEKEHLAGRISEKYQGASEALALSHIENAQHIARAGDLDEAAELYGLAMNLTSRQSTREMIEKGIKELAGKNLQNLEHDSSGSAGPGPEQALLDYENGFDADDEELFAVLCHALSDETARVYESLGKTFARGYIALNQGYFSKAVKELSAALEENPQHFSLISLELATAFLHAEEHERARELLEACLKENPSEIRAYQLLCEMHWEKGRFDDAKQLLASAPKQLRDIAAMQMLLGETFFQAGDLKRAEEIFQAYEDFHGSDDIVSRALAKTMEASGQTEQARDMYARLMNQCASCGKTIDPFIKRRFAELSFKSGETSTKLLDLFFSLVQEDPDNRGVYYTRIGRLYEKRGEESQAGRYLSLAAQMGQKI